MSSSPASSPTRETSPPSQFQLTPRSKVKALLASLDNDSDDEIESGSARARVAADFMKLDRPSQSKEPIQDSSDHAHMEEAEEDGDDEEEIVRPRGRMASRMIADADDSDSRSGNIAGNGRDRAKQPTRKSPQPANVGGTEDSDEYDGPVVARKRKIRVSRSDTPKSTTRNISESPKLFVSPMAQRSNSVPYESSDSDGLPSDPLANDRFKALVERKRQERLAKEAETAAEKAKKMAERQQQNQALEDAEDVSDDDDVERRLTQSRPARKASKKALEEMHRETQRLSRNTQLAHNPITKKKVTKASFLARFNYKSADYTEEKTAEAPHPTSSSPASHSDTEMHETPPTSPASHSNEAQKPAIAIEPIPIVEKEGSDEEMPALEEALEKLPQRHKKLDKGKGKAAESQPEAEKPIFKRPIRVRPAKAADMKLGLNDSDSDLEIVSSKSPDAKSRKLDSIFNRIPERQAREPHSLQALRMLAHIGSPEKQNKGRNKKPSMTTSELKFSLQQRARQQATREREEKLQALREKGIIVQTAEEREKEMAEVEDLISKARREGDEIMKREKAAARKERKANGETASIGDSSDDEEWAEKEPLDLSGSDDEESAIEGSDASEDEEDQDGMELDDDESSKAMPPNPMFDDEANETDAEDGDNRSAEEGMVDREDAEAEDEEDDHQSLAKKPRRRNANVISDDEEEDEHQQVQTPSVTRVMSPTHLRTKSPAAPNSVLRSATKTFIPGLTVAGAAGLGLTQIFAGTMDESQIDASPTATNSASQNIHKENSLAFLRNITAPELPEFVPTMQDDTQDVVLDSQPHNIEESQSIETQTQGFQLQFSQSQIHGFDSLVYDEVASQYSEFPEATQDAGFQHMTPIRGRFADAPPSTVDTVVLEPDSIPEASEETPIVKKKGKLRRRAQINAFSDDDEPATRQEDEAGVNASVFDVMQKASRRQQAPVDEFDKKTSKAKEMVHEQADESEDEYAGLGGASDDESGGEEDAYVKEIIDDEGGNKVDESKLAAFFA
jgi:mediator of replication checkpoint protein 1